jgi:hypothetical protein
MDGLAIADALEGKGRLLELLATDPAFVCMDHLVLAR